MTWSEDSIHRWLSKRPRSAKLAGSQGHDAAVLKTSSGRPVLCVDACVEGVHFEDHAPDAAVGKKAAGRALSDLAATGARPEALLLALRAPGGACERRLRRLIRGVGAMGEAHGAPLVGGDTTCAPGPLSLTVTALGRFDSKSKPPGRDRAKPGQMLVVTGPLGGSLLGRHLKIRPRIQEAGWLISLGATALMDISDGLLLDLGRMARASGVAMDLESVPQHRDAKRRAKMTGRSSLEHALTDGEDYELLACLPSNRVPELLAQAPGRCPGLAILGRVRAGHGVQLSFELPPEWQGNSEWLREKGWLHGTR
ncbi:MAG: thiamine-phosphate kinase [Planctomycetota bacterium]|nr:thiamine-phosphate kinase [Planctomycetota bacterium]